jgi:hypothetical protein
MMLSNAVARLLLLGYFAVVFLLFGSDSFAAVLIGVGAGCYCRNPPKPRRQAELARMSDVPP